MPRNVNWVQLVVILIFVLMTVISWSYRKFKEHQANQARKTAAARRREQLLRTGRVDDEPELPTRTVIATAQPAGSPNVHDDARRKLQELAAKRRRELEEIARRSSGGSTIAPAPASGQRPGFPAARPRPASAPPTPSFSPPPQRTKPASRPQPTPKPRPARSPSPAEAARRDAESAARAAAARERAMRQRAAEASEQADRARRAQAAADADQSAIAAAAASRSVAQGLRPTPLGAAGGGLDQWRRAIVLMEVLGPPAADREPGQREF